MLQQAQARGLYQQLQLCTLGQEPLPSPAGTAPFCPWPSLAGCLTPGPAWPAASPIPTQSPQLLPSTHSPGPTHTHPLQSPTPCMELVLQTHVVALTTLLPATRHLPSPCSLGTFDAVLVVGALSEGQVPCSAIPDLLRVTKPGEELPGQLAWADPCKQAGGGHKGSVGLLTMDNREQMGRWYNTRGPFTVRWGAPSPVSSLTDFPPSCIHGSLLGEPCSYLALVSPSGKWGFPGPALGRADSHRDQFAGSACWAGS